MNAFAYLWPTGMSARARSRRMQARRRESLEAECLYGDVLERREVMTAAMAATAAVVHVALPPATRLVLPAAAAAVPTVPTNLIASEGNKLVRLSWAAPSSDGGRPVTDYVIQYSMDGGRSWRLFRDGQSTSTSTEVTGLANDLTYIFRVEAVNAVGRSEGTTVAATPSAARDFEYIGQSNGIIITKYIGKASDVSVPQFINETRVTELGVGAFQGRGDITRVTLPSGLRKIGNNAFDGCGSLVSVVIPNGVTSIGDAAFISCDKLQVVNLPASVTSISTFRVFWGCRNLMSINVDRANTQYASHDGILYNKEKTLLYRCPGGKTGAITLAPTLKTIGHHSFEHCYAITKVIIPANVALIEDGVFRNCPNLRAFHFLGNAPTVRSAFDPDVHAAAYYVRGTSGWGATIGGIPTATTPSAPTQGAVTLSGSGSGGISWKAPISNGGSAITGYLVQVTAIDGTLFREVTLAAAATSYTGTGLRNSTLYSFQVAAVNAAGVGLLSQPIMIRPIFVDVSLFPHRMS